MILKRIGLVGFGVHIKKTLLPCLEGELGAKIYGVCVLNPNKYNEERKKYRFFSNIAELCNSNDIDVIITAANHQAHEEVLNCSLRANKPCYVEKPPVLNMQALVDLYSNANGKENLFHFGLNYRESELLKKAKELAINYGGIANVRIEFSSENPISQKGFSSIKDAILYETGIHAIDLARSLLPNLNLTWMKLNKFREIYQYCLTLENTKNQYAVVEYGNYTNEFRLLINIYTTKGVVIHIRNLNEICITGKEAIDIESFMGMKMSLRYEWPTRRSSYAKNGYLTCLQKCINHQKPACELIEVISLYKLLESVKMADID